MMRPRSGLFLAVAVAITGLVYRSLPGVYFHGDDFLHLFAIIDSDLFEYLLRPHGGHILIARNAVFVAFYQLFGVNAEPYFTAALLTHLLNTVLLFRVISNWTESAPIAALGAMLWGTCPVHAATLGWYSVYGQVLVGTILLLILHQGSRRERAGRPLPSWIVVAWPLALIIASTCFGVGIALLLAAPLALLCLLPFSRVLLVTCLVLAVIAVTTPTAYRALIEYHSQLVGNWGEIWKMWITMGSLQYKLPIVTMCAYMFPAGIGNLLLSFGGTGLMLPSVAAWSATAVYAALLLAAMILAPARVRLRVLGLLLVAGSCYGMIAAARATLLPVTKLAASASVPRYHYFATIPLVIVLCCCIVQITGRLRRSARAEVTLLVIVLVAGVFLYLRSEPFIDLQDRARKEAADFITMVRSRLAEVPPEGEARIINQRFGAAGALLANLRSGFPGWAGAFVVFFPSNVIEGKRVKFVVGDAEFIKLVAKGKRTHDLFVVGDVTPDSAPTIYRRTL